MGCITLYLWDVLHPGHILDSYHIKSPHLGPLPHQLCLYFWFVLLGPLNGSINIGYPLELDSKSYLDYRQYLEVRGHFRLKYTFIHQALLVAQLALRRVVLCILLHFFSHWLSRHFTLILVIRLARLRNNPYLQSFTNLG